MLAVSAHIGLAGDAMSDETREWWGTGRRRAAPDLAHPDRRRRCWRWSARTSSMLLKPHWTWLDDHQARDFDDGAEPSCGRSSPRPACWRAARSRRRPAAATACSSWRARWRRWCSCSATCSSSPRSCTAPSRSVPTALGGEPDHRVFSLCEVEAHLRVGLRPSHGRRAGRRSTARARRRRRRNAGPVASRLRGQTAPRRTDGGASAAAPDDAARLRRAGLAHVVAGEPERVLAAHVLSQPPGPLLSRRVAPARPASVHRVRRRGRPARWRRSPPRARRAHPAVSDLQHGHQSRGGQEPRVAGAEGGIVRLHARVLRLRVPRRRRSAGRAEGGGAARRRGRGGAAEGATTAAS